MALLKALMQLPENEFTFLKYLIPVNKVCVCVCACVRACVRVCTTICTYSDLISSRVQPPIEGSKN